MDIFPKKLLIGQISIWILTEEIHSFYYEETRSGPFLAAIQTFHGNIMLRILTKFIFDFLATLLFAKTTWVILKLLRPTFEVLNLLFVLSTSFLAYGSFAKVVPLFKSFPMVCSMSTFERFSALFGTRFKICHFCFSAVAEAVCTPLWTRVFLTSWYPMTKIKYSPVA